MAKINKFNYERRYKRLRINFVMLVLCFFILAFCFFYLFMDSFTIYSNPINLNKMPTKIADLNYLNLTKDETITFEKIFNQLNPLYLTGQGEIYVVKNISKWCNDCNGANYGHGKKIYLQYNNNDMQIKRTLCHELLHSFFYKNLGESGEEDPYHAIIYNLARKDVCYE